ncbi:NAD-dependent epimerase/dehydratase family protein [Vibrio breoganii]|uniref:NAD-dependent epimerase/dehydratase family protein n=1 Tax=Vibrio breoganii TaxID=553239 RepID=UPI0021C4A4B1|nr:NAD-dependent epimerase/dehydratase family protein [Vibrio breoganii]MDN3715927.1 NAD-dependent epimerase/dehydratase family protein [Vibrio breoganii]
MKIAITGASGFIGSELSSCKDIDYSISRNVINVKKNNEKLNFNSLDDLDDILYDCDVLIHLAGLAHREFSEEEYNQNIIYSSKVATLAFKNGIKRFIYVSSTSVYGNINTKSNIIDEHHLCQPITLAAKCKLETENRLRLIANQFSKELLIVRSPLVYGKNAPASINFLSCLVKRFPILPFGLCNSKRDYIFVDNLCDLLIELAKSDTVSGNLILASDLNPLSMNELTSEIAKGLNKHLYNIPIPRFVLNFILKLIGKSSYSNQIYGQMILDKTKLKEELNWVPPYTVQQAMKKLR